MKFLKEDLLREVTFKMSRSGGKGGQNVNKVSSKVELNFDIKASLLLSEEQKELLLKKLSNRINAAGILQIITEEERSQYRNKIKSLDKLNQLIVVGLYQQKPRKATKPKRSSIEERLKSKLANAQKKINRSKYIGD